MTNPFKQFSSDLFASRETVNEALTYADSVLNGLTGGDKAAAWTAIMILVNTASKLWPEPGQVEAPASDLTEAALLRERIVRLEQRLGGADFFLTEAALDQRIETVVEARLQGWTEENFNERADQWLTDHADLDNEIERWIENNLDVEDAVQDVLRNASLRINF